MRKGTHMKRAIGCTWRKALMALAMTIAAAAFSCSPLAGEMIGNPQVSLAADLTVSNIKLSSGEASWNGNDNAYKYNVKLHRKNSTAATKTTSETSYDFSSYFTSAGDYYVEVQAVAHNGEKGGWYSSGYQYVDSSEARDIRGYSDSRSYDNEYSRRGPGVQNNYPVNYGPNYNMNNPYYNNSSTIGYGTPAQNMQNNGQYGMAGTWQKDGNGWWYQYANGTYPKNCWTVINGSYYCFDVNGYRRYGWIFYNNKWYYCGTDGALVANTYTPDGYYVGSDGVWVP